jgi:Holliday junction resolvase RusA-like endonuclease
MQLANCFFEIPGDPQGKGRPRYSRVKKPYTPEKTREYERAVADCYTVKYGGIKLLGPLAVKIIAYSSIPKSTSKKKRLEMLNGTIKNTKKPDVDNIAKIILDGLNGVAYEDDKQVCSLTVEKFFDERPRVCVEITAI